MDGVVDALDAATGVTCVVGAGGKKTTLYTLAPRIPRAVVTATVRIPIFDGQMAAVHVQDNPVPVLDQPDGWPIGVVPAREGDRYLGYDPATVDDIAAADGADAVLVKADGARTRWLKAPNADEPQLPTSTTTVVPIASARVVGEPLTQERVHRPQRVSAITGRERGEVIRAADVAAVLASDAGGRKDVPPGATVVPLINMVDDEALESVAWDIADRLLEQTTLPRVVLARMIDDDPLVAVVE